MSQRAKIIVAGAFGKMGRNAIETFLANKDKFDLKIGLVRDLNNLDYQITKYYEEHGIKIANNLEAELGSGDLDILVELTTPDSVFHNSKLALKHGVRPVIGATGLSDADIDELAKLSNKNSLGTIVAPNFSIGAILMMKFAAKAAAYMDRYEIIEMHHEQKLDSPSGTAIKTAKLIAKNAKSPNKAAFVDHPSRGQSHYGIPIHSLRLQGFVASQEVIFGGQGQTLSIRHNTIDRSSFMPGILFACEKIMGLNNLVYGLENLI